MMMSRIMEESSRTAAVQQAHKHSVQMRASEWRALGGESPRRKKKKKAKAKKEKERNSGLVIGLNMPRDF